jgi:hypothetical protein
MLHIVHVFGDFRRLTASPPKDFPYLSAVSVGAVATYRQFGQFQKIQYYHDIIVEA